MNEFVAQGYSNKKLILLNTCQKFLQVHTLGDITNGDGSSIPQSVKHGAKPNWSSSTLIWPNQTSPEASVWKIWKSAIRKTFELNGQVAPGLRRHQWAKKPARNFLWYYDPTTNCLLKKLRSNKWKMFRESIQRGRPALHPVFHCIQTELNSLPSQARPATVQSCGIHRVKFTGSGTAAQTEINPTYASFEEYINTLPEDEKWPMSDIEGTENINHILQSILSGNCVLVSDGSYHRESQQ